MIAFPLHLVSLRHLALFFFHVAGVHFSCVSVVPFMNKVAPQYLATHVDRLLKALLVCFFDESWPVRDAACVASGRFAGAYPEECRPSLDKLYERLVGFSMQSLQSLVDVPEPDPFM